MNILQRSVMGVFTLNVRQSIVQIDYLLVKCSEFESIEQNPLNAHSVFRNERVRICMHRFNGMILCIYEEFIRKAYPSFLSSFATASY